MTGSSIRSNFIGKMPKLFPVIVAIALLTLSACGQKTFSEMADDMSPDGVALINESKLLISDSIVVLDAREEVEYKVSHIQGARHVGFDQFNLEGVEDISKETTIIVYCSVGYRSGEICKQLQAAGYTKVFNLWGGIFDWINHDHPVFNEEGITSNIHPYSSSWARWLQKGVITYE